ncbi:MAG TPA: aminotransferase class I/II-fold pyridoxal phosphate-dependent enzyme, partial [Bacillota bacterium]|nr:aminotransferase class I/II-fold pyridoxal phosphate-dependent enzyme [Bacillota bacterium]
KYTSDYEKACRLLAAERKRFYKALAEVRFLRVIPSQANYFLGEVTSGYTSTQLTELLLAKYNILIKDCTGKTGFENRHFVRIAVRSSTDNDELVAKLKELNI